MRLRSFFRRELGGDQPALLERGLDEVLYEYRDGEAMRHLGGAVPRSMAWRAFMTMGGAWHLAGFSMFSLIEKATGKVKRFLPL